MADNPNENPSADTLPRTPELPKQAPPAANPGGGGNGRVERVEAHRETRDAQQAQHARVDGGDHQKEVAEHIDRLRGEGHGPQRHLDPTDAQLQARLGQPAVDEQTGAPKLKGNGHVEASQHIDPMTESTVDGVTGKPHGCGDYATRFDSAADFAAADRYMRAQIGDSGPASARVPISDVLGPDGHQRMTGYYHDPSAPGQFKSVDFTGGTIYASYRRDADGTLSLRTMYADPAPFNPSQAGGTDK